MSRSFVTKAFRKMSTVLFSLSSLGNPRYSHSVDRGTQILLQSRYQELWERWHQRMTFQDVEFRAFSQNGEDGILLYIYSLIGTTNKKAVEMCAGDGIECNSANLIINHGWEGFLFDARDDLLNRGRRFYQTCPETFRLPPKLVSSWITRDNVNQVLEEHSVTGEIDLLSLDMDGVDYWIWQELDCIRPRVAIMEYNNRWGPDRAVTVPYQNCFRTSDGDYFGASLPAFVKLAQRKGYRLIGCNRFNTNAFFLHNGIGEEVFPEVPTETCLTSAWARYQHQNRLPLIEKLEWIEV